MAIGDHLTTEEHTKAHAGKITGYRELSKAEIDAINQIKAKGQELQELIETLEESANPDLRWLSIGRTDLQRGIMSLVRSVAKPPGF